MLGTKERNLIAFDLLGEEEFQNKSLFDLDSQLERFRLYARQQTERNKRGEKGQFLTPAPVAHLMASMLQATDPDISILDAGAGIGSLFAACVVELCAREQPPRSICVTAYEIDPLLLPTLQETVELCRNHCNPLGITFNAQIRSVDFLKEVSENLAGGLFSDLFPLFTVVILNPPYRKISATSHARQYLRRIGIETTNLYTGFMGVAIQLLSPEGEMVTITPRSFCNGVYFRNFREAFLQEMALQRLHLFDSRQEAFLEDAVLQETLIVHAIKTRKKPEIVSITSSVNATDEMLLSRMLPYEEVVHSEDAEHFIRISADGASSQIVQRMARFQTSLQDLDLSVSTGRVVDFRATLYLRKQPENESVPLLYPLNLENGEVIYPKPTRKPQALLLCKETEALCVPNEHYVLVKRFSSKEQHRRVISSFFQGGVLPGTKIGFENHLNYFHHKGRGLDLWVAKGLSAFLNSTLVDAFFRQFSGHTQVNATDLRNLRYPTLSQLSALGKQVDALHLSQEELDAILEKEFFTMAEPSLGDPIALQKRIQEALGILRSLGFPKPQINERSALTLLALLRLLPASAWSEASNPLCGITPIMDFIGTHYHKKYAPNTRETVRRQTVHQFLEAGLIVRNPDDPKRPINSGKTVYQIEREALKLLQSVGTEGWEKNLQSYLALVGTLKARYAQERDMVRIPITVAEDTETQCQNTCLKSHGKQKCG